MFISTKAAIAALSKSKRESAILKLAAVRNEGPTRPPYWILGGLRTRP